MIDNSKNPATKVPIFQERGRRDSSPLLCIALLVGFEVKTGDNVVFSTRSHHVTVAPVAVSSLVNGIEVSERQRCALMTVHSKRATSALTSRSGWRFAPGTWPPSPLWASSVMLVCQKQKMKQLIDGITSTSSGNM